MKNVLLATLLCTMILAGCHSAGGNQGQRWEVTPSGVRDTTVVDVDKKYSSIAASADMQVILSDSVQQVTVVADTVLLPLVEVSISDGILHIGYKNGGISKSGNLPGPIVWVPYTTKVREITLSGVCNLRSQHPIVGSKFQLTLSGASQAACYFDMPDGTLTLDISGASKLNATGTVQALKADVSGASKVAGTKENGQYTFTVGDAEIDLSGACSMILHSENSLTGNISGASTLHYTGEPKKTRLSTSGASRVKPE